jgi:DNA primase
MYAERTIEQVKSLSLLDAVSRRLGNKLKKNGALYVACCPFHEEKTPSFKLKAADTSWKCFGCQKSGSVIDFVMLYDNVDFVQAVELLCNEAGIEPEMVNDSKTPEQRKEEKDAKAHMYDMMEYAAQVYEMNLGDEQREMLYRRGVTEEDITKWRLGYAPDGWRTITAWAVNGGRLDMAVKLDLVKEKNEPNGDVKHYDTFRNRIMLPICDEQGRVVAFGAWNWKGEANQDGKAVKYVNSATTALYNKSMALYGMHHAKKCIVQTKRCAVTEGYFDVISAHRAGLQETVAPCGTALTQEQLKWLRAKNCERVRIMTDNDASGVTAALRAVDMILEAGMVPEKAVWTEEHKDVDDLVKRLEMY